MRAETAKYLLVYVLGLALALTIRAAAHPFVGGNFPFFTVYFVAVLAAYFHGFWACLASALVGWLAADYLFLEPYGHFLPQGTTQIIGSAFFWATTLPIAWLGETALRRLAESRKQLNTNLAITENALEGLFMMDSEGRTTFVNPAGERMFGYTTGELQGKVLHDQIHSRRVDGSPLPWVECPLRQVFEGKAITNHEDVFFRKDGSPVPVLCSKAPIFENGKVQAAVLVVTDLTQRKRDEEALIDINRTLESRVVDRTADLEGFCYAIAHDLRQNIRNVNVSARLLAEQMDENTAQELQSELLSLRQASHGMATMVDDLLHYTRSASLQLRREHIDVTRLARQVFVRCCPEGEIVVHEGLEAEGDETMVGLILQNLIENACKYRGDSSPKICIGRDGQGFFVQDNGIGFDMRYAERIFKPFERLHGGDIQGSGIGLATVRRLVERHGGRIWAESAEGEGATFRFTLG